MLQSPMPNISFDRRTTAWRELSWGCLAFCGSAAPCFTRPSKRPSEASTRMRPLPSAPTTVSFSTTMSTARTMNLCFVASSNILQAPVCSSVTKSSKLLAPPMPKPSTLTLWSRSCCFTVSTVTSLLTRSPAGSWVAAVKAEVRLSALEVCHHSRVKARSLPGSWQVNLWLFMSAYLAPDLPVFWRRSTNSARRAAMPAFAPLSFISGLKSPISSGFVVRGFPHSLPSSAMNEFDKAVAQSNRLASSRSSNLWMISWPSAGHRLGTTNFLSLTSCSPVNGNLPETKPNMTTPIAQQSTFIP
mmetsp:Transcript_49600/g.127991  ORF Transcript_49600/g.127991 Transcript_49600/m.127991 type:complete len:301 (+) Transcript_49600:726-1628(+)